MTSRNLFAQRLSQNINAILALIMITSGTQLHATSKVIHEFNYTKGVNPWARLVVDSSGNLYGTAASGGQVKCECGVVFKLSRAEAGGLAETILHSFRGNPDGAIPRAGVVIDGTGNIYGTTQAGGGKGCENGIGEDVGCGTVYELSPTLTGGWTYSVIYSFTGGADGSVPWSQLVLDSSNNLYGTTQSGGSHGFGAVFELSHSSGTWVETVLYSFTGGTDGANPYAGVIFDNSGNLYGTTGQGGHTGGICADQGCGVVFELSNSSGVWTETVLYTFLGGADGSLGGTDGAFSLAPLTRDALGNLYSTTLSGGAADCRGGGCGVVFELSNSSGVWTETVIHTFQPGSNGFDGSGGGSPYAGVTLDTLGNLYGATTGGGIQEDGVVFELSPSGGSWTEKVLHSFSGRNGDFPASGVTLDGFGNVFGATVGGGLVGESWGVIYEITP
jgi:uncharacterized repeat protein (TIGR03803 family)